MRLFGLIGYPLTHSFSKSYFAEKFRKENITDCAYDNFQLADIKELPKMISEHPQLAGFNITIPYKEAVLPYLHDSNDLVRQTGACNCVKISKGKLVGYNTDVTGFERSLLKRLPAGTDQALILGAGGASMAVEFVLRKNGISYQVASRREAVGDLTYDQISPLMIAEYTLIINTTPVGMYPKTDEMPPLPYEAITPRHLLVDLIYNPEKTLFLQEGERRGSAIQNGYEMLEIQAEESWKIWNQ